MNKGNIGEFIKQRRNELNITQQELADKLNTSRENLSKWERGLAIPHTEYLKNLSEYLQVSVADLISGRINSDKEVDDVIVDIIDKSHKNKILFIKTIISLVVIFVIAFLAYYFVSNYNRIKVYSIDTENVDYEMDESILLVLKDNVYFMLGDIHDKSNEEIKLIKLYYFKDDSKSIVFEGKILPRFIKLSKEDNLNDIINNTYLELTNINNEIKTIKINLRKRKSNDDLFENKIQSNDRSPHFYFDNIEIPDLSKFEYDDDKNKYVYKKKDLIFEYSKLTNSLSILYSKDQYYETLTFIGKNSNQIFYNMNGEKECMITYENEKIITNNCQNNNGTIELLLKKYNDFIA